MTPFPQIVWWRDHNYGIGDPPRSWGIVVGWVCTDGYTKGVVRRFALGKYGECFIENRIGELHPSSHTEYAAWKKANKL